MGREIRRVPADWSHPMNGKHHAPLRDGFNAALAAWEDARAKHPDCPKAKEYSFEEWYGSRPLADDYMPDWPAEQRTHYQMYENTSEGTPISPVFASPEEVARWCADNGASAFAHETASYESWLRIASGGWAPSMAVVDGEVQSGVEHMRFVPVDGPSVSGGKSE